MCIRDRSILEEQPGDENPQPFSHQTDLSQFPFLPQVSCHICLLYTSDAADERSSVDLGGRRIIQKK